MKLYMTEIGQWAGTQADARAFKATHGVNFVPVDVPTDKPGLLDWLNANEVGKVEAATHERATDAPIQSGSIEPITEDAFEALALPMQLHLAALALENARAKIKP